MHFSTSRSPRHGFTLIELLVVIAIIALLAAILFPVFGRARENARRSACQSNLKQIGLGVIQYLQDFDEKFPAGTDMTDPTNNTGGGAGWAGQVYPYVKSTQIFLCPNDVTNKGNPPANNYKISYALNSNLVQPKLLGQADLQNVSQVVLGFEVVLWDNNFGWTQLTDPLEGCPGNLDTATGTCYPLDGSTSYAGARRMHSVAGRGNTGTNLYTSTGTSATVGTTPGKTNYATGAISVRGTSYTLDARHFDSGNYLAADGHVKWIKGANVSGGQNARRPDCKENEIQNGSNTGCTLNAGSATAAGTQALKDSTGSRDYQLTFSAY